MPNIASGDTNQNSSVLWTQSNYTGKVTFEYSTDPNFTTIAGSITQTITDINLPVKVSVTDLSPGTQYYYRVTDANSQTTLGTFKTAAEIGQQKGLKFGVSGDWRGELSPYPAIANADEQNLDFFILHGDTIYADYPSPAVNKSQAETITDFRLKYQEVYGDRFGLNTWGDLRSSTSIFATIDDHEVTNDFAGGADVSTDSRFSDSPGILINESTLYQTGLQAFQEYHPIKNQTYANTGDRRTENKPKLYRSTTYGKDAQIIILDNRSFRDQTLPNVTNPSDSTQVNQFLTNSFNPSRTMLGKAQLDDLKHDLLTAHNKGVTWKFILVPEPIQNLGVIFASDRFEGYAAERTEILKFIDENNINNVVFIAADIHGNLVNNLTYQLSPNSQQIPTNSFEVTTGSVAFNAPFGPSVIGLASQLKRLTPQQVAFYNSLTTRDAKDNFIRQLVDQQITPFGYDPLGLDNNLSQANGLINAQLIQGGYVNTHTYGWTKFDIDQNTQKLTVTTYGIDPYTEAELTPNSPVLTRNPVIINQFEVTPTKTPKPSFSLSLLIVFAICSLCFLPSIISSIFKEK
ncbi:phosphodiesterase/alkaline phosphatase D-like protein [Rippkaea orientalis PCC 8801]|uniref:Phosphodiesterase/alkaline phosphatase D-like protein n=1 Tax=Rippkaea orientalis (strain PCC 8801 / RF-1) TaxID=41431 RepID=B7K5D5_RIPO1|nr:alkaline phosphatase D family protein [Rippkaea orientalis]ACK67961.1 phosphodiesterase/alkaline phosphatase D-like protein [Rippkaea orientalis PCC 8801]